MTIREWNNKDFEAVLAITLLAFAPIHESFQQILGERIFDQIYHDWRGGYRRYLNSLLQADEKGQLLVAEEEREIVGFIVYTMDLEKSSGELELNAVHPAQQNKGIGPQMYQHVLALMEEQGIKLVDVTTGGDPSHAPARRAYEKCGFTPLPLVRYYKAL